MIPARRTSGLFATVVLTACAGEDWPALPEIGADEYAADFSEWRQDRRDRLVTPPGGPVLWVALSEIPEGTSEFGSDPRLRVALPVGLAPSLAGTLTRSGFAVRLAPAPGVQFADSARQVLLGPIDLAHDRTDEPTTVWLGSLGLRVHSERANDRLWLRVWDEASPARQSFELPEAYPLDAVWRIRARFEAYDDPRTIDVLDVTSGTLEYTVPGELVFDHGGRRHRLLATASETSTSFFIMLRDESAPAETYPIGRYMRVPFPEEDGWTSGQDGWTVIDFNRAYNAPCAFTEYSVCGIPPRENHLTFAVTAGEKRPQTP